MVRGKSQELDVEGLIYSPGVIAVDLRGISDVAMFEVGTYASRRFLDSARGAQHRWLQVRHVLRRHPTLDLTLQIAVEVLGWIQLRAVRWQIVKWSPVDNGMDAPTP